jgi:hypothetical protein
MPKSKHRRKPGEKAVAHSGRGKSGRPFQLPGWDHNPDLTELPLFAWAERTEVHLPETPTAPSHCHPAQQPKDGFGV